MLEFSLGLVQGCPWVEEDGPATVGCLSFPRAGVQPWATLSPAAPGAPGTLPGRAPPLTAAYIPGSRALARGRSCLCRTNGINQNKRQPACFYLLPIQGFKRIYRHQQPDGEGEPRGVTPAGRDRQGQPCPGCSDAGGHATGHPSALLCPGLLHRALARGLGSTSRSLTIFQRSASHAQPVPRQPTGPWPPTSQGRCHRAAGALGAERGTRSAVLAAPAAPPPRTLQALGIQGAGSSSRIQPTPPSELNPCLLLQGCHSC